MTLRCAPDDFAHWCTIETQPQLSRRYGVGDNLVRKWLRMMAPAVLSARFETIRGHRRAAGAAVHKSGINRRVRTAGPVDDGPRQQRAADRAFKAHFLAVCKVNGWDAYPFEYRRAA